MPANLAKRFEQFGISAVFDIVSQRTIALTGPGGRLIPTSLMATVPPR